MDNTEIQSILQNLGEDRKIRIGQFGNLEVFVADLYAGKFDFNPESLDHLQELKDRLK